MEEEKNIIVRGNDLSDFEKGFITACHSLNAKCTDICDLLASFGYERGYSCIKKFVHNLKLKNHYIPITPTKRKEKCGRKSLIGEDTGKKMVEEVKSNRMCTASQIQKNADLNHNHVSPTTVERFLNKEGYFARKMPTKPQISSANREKRLKFANDHKNWTINQGSKIMFSDESQILPMPFGTLFVRKKNDENIFDPQFLNLKPQNTVKIMVGGCICYTGPVDLVWVHVNINSEVYLSEILESRVKSYEFLKEQGIFQQDNATCHKAQKIMKGFENKEIEVISGPPQSPDLSPIENIWAFIKHKVGENHKLISTKNDLGDFLQQLWWSIELKEICKNCFESLPLRIEEVIDQKGGATSY